MDATITVRCRRDDRHSLPMLATALDLAVAVRSFAADHPGFHARSEAALHREAVRRGWVAQHLRPGPVRP